MCACWPSLIRLSWAKQCARSTCWHAHVQGQAPGQRVHLRQPVCVAGVTGRVHLCQPVCVAGVTGRVRGCVPFCRVYPGLLERVCVAHMLHGYLQCQPAYVKVAADVLAKLPASGEVLVLQVCVCVRPGACSRARYACICMHETPVFACPQLSGASCWRHAADQAWWPLQELWLLLLLPEPPRLHSCAERLSHDSQSLWDRARGLSQEQP